ncbi:unnamed protein product [Adineta ricciae]|uniref:Uncharacterized protein n=1 Tax=Adineta ricciae TaxID=249248 RepID=A0A815EUX4_ADIRI|nr:unnamed protein product [Adineta ricciae]CAF1311111.1 unnamed protein product [Adineta ricciae]
MNLLQNSESKRCLDLHNDMIKFINTKLAQLFKQENQTQIVQIDRQYRYDLNVDPISLELSEKLVYDDAGYIIRNESRQ